jgi:chloramphenicol 3-O phosphotransferase
MRLRRRARKQLMRAASQAASDGWEDQLMLVPPHSPGRIVLLNGASSSGKTSIAEQLLLMLDPPHFHMSVDAINGMRAKAKTVVLNPAELAEVLARTRAGFHRAVAGMAQAGNNVVADYVFSERWRLLDCLAVMAGLEVVFVGVRCSPGELARREHARGDREPGLAAAQQHRVHSHGIYDIEVDTTTAMPRECAALIERALARGERPNAFDRLRAALQNEIKPDPL